LSTPTATTDARIAICGRCGATLGADSWDALELVEHLSPGNVRALVTRWPGEAGIEVRRCTCGSPLARKAAG
jgi:hypothetical protein